jgi:hypothetical protein
VEVPVQHEFFLVGNASEENDWRRIVDRPVYETFLPLKRQVYLDFCTKYLSNYCLFFLVESNKERV